MRATASVYRRRPWNGELCRFVQPAASWCAPTRYEAPSFSTERSPSAKIGFKQNYKLCSDVSRAAKPRATPWLRRSCCRASSTTHPVHAGPRVPLDTPLFSSSRLRLNAERPGHVTCYKRGFDTRVFPERQRFSIVSLCELLLRYVRQFASVYHSFSFSFSSSFKLRHVSI